MNSDQYQNKTLIFFDGHCGLCNGFVNTLLAFDIFDKLRFATLQGDMARNLLPPATLSKLETVVVIHNEKTYEKSEAALIAIAELNYLFSLLHLLRFIPAFIRDGVYNLISRNRYKVFGYKETCRIPTEKEKRKFIDS